MANLTTHLAPSFRNNTEAFAYVILNSWLSGSTGSWNKIVAWNGLQSPGIQWACACVRTFVRACVTSTTILANWPMIILLFSIHGVVCCCRSQWERSTPGVEAVTVTGANMPTLAVQTTVNATYACIADNGYGKNRSTTFVSVVQSM